MHAMNYLALTNCSTEKINEILLYACVLEVQMMGREFDWCYRLRNLWVDNLVSKNTEETLPKFLYIYIYIYRHTRIYII